MGAVMGSLPITLVSGARPNGGGALGVVAVGGLLFSRVITRYITPIVHTNV